MSSNSAAWVQAKVVADLLSRAGIACRTAPDAERLCAEVWGKVAVNAVINSLSALLNVTNGGIATVLRSSAGEKLAGDIVAEVAAVAMAKGIVLADPLTDARQARSARCDALICFTSFHHLLSYAFI
jgi:ketopantoate reductase